ncbi:MAG TPA: ABC-F family ATP-binding cassette domain-containing protein [Gemmatimonadaceae bacterium]|nr:ABC-F family ATP-binding cassette domain-containing protein [Gemmatimonadaceae bacterium]
MTQIVLSDVGIEYGATTVLTDVSFTVSRGERWGIIGRNGTGKTSLFRLLTTEQLPSNGSVWRSPGLRVTLLEQHRDFGDASSVWEVVAGRFADLLALERSLAEQAEKLGELGERANRQVLERYDRDLERFEREGGYTFAPRVDAVLHGLGFEPNEARSRPVSTLSGGERGRIGLARQLAAPADVLLLDEPTNHLDLETTRWLEQYLRAVDETVLLISHDRSFLENVIDHVLHLESHTATTYAGTYSDFVAQRTERRLAQQRAFDQQRRTIAQEEDYIRRNIAGQNSAQAKGRRTRLARLPRLSPPPAEDDAMALRLETAERGGDQVVVAERVHLAVGDRTLVESFTGVVRRGDVIGFIGPNGAGKSTLLRAIAGERDVEDGSLRLGSSISAAHYRQDLAQVPTDRALFDIIGDLRPSWERRQVLSHLARFGFPGDEAKRTAAMLSGGERSRVALAMIVLMRANLLLLDEPTNHLDVESIEALEDAVERYEGTVIVVSHDRALLRSLASRVWVLHDGRIIDFDGSFEEWETRSAEREHAAAVAAAEEEALRRVRERQKLRRVEDRSRDDRRKQRTILEALTAAESEVARLEQDVVRITSALEDPSLYATAEGTRQAAELGRALEESRQALDAALERWATASEAANAVDASGKGGSSGR